MTLEQKEGIMTQPVDSPATKNLGPQIEFARHVYDNQQAIIRQLDVKAGVFVTLLVFLASGALPHGGEPRNSQAG